MKWKTNVVIEEILEPDSIREPDLEKITQPESQPLSGEEPPIDQENYETNEGNEHESQPTTASNVNIDDLHDEVLEETDTDYGDSDELESLGSDGELRSTKRSREFEFNANISERDEGALKFLKDITWTRIDNPKGFKLEFYFDTNPYFKNSDLTKIYHMIDEDEPIMEKAIG
ncbi:hypothetical protein Fot_21922 [Forsythia ovata]|uniref:Uncharacterized protein n=1 Tax=Forsythia ovata TaxID=205694 RepID=A0ABD1UW81_9LAMI